MDVFAVEAFAASWIEINEGDASGIVNAVEAFAASWIEIVTSGASYVPAMSKPLRLRGLKYTLFVGHSNAFSRSLCGFVD